MVVIIRIVVEIIVVIIFLPKSASTEVTTPNVLLPRVYNVITGCREVYGFTDLIYSPNLHLHILKHGLLLLYIGGVISAFSSHTVYNVVGKIV